MSEKLKIVVADDEIHILRVLQLKLEGVGFEVITAHDGLQAWQIIGRYSPDLVVTDLQMPGMTGLEVAGLMAESTKFKAIPVVMLTARGFYLDQDELARTNIVTVVSKPFSPRNLVAIIDQILNSTVISRGGS